MANFRAYFRKVVAEWTGQRERIAHLEWDLQVETAIVEVQAGEIARLKTELAVSEIEVRRQAISAEVLQAYATSLERKFILASPAGGFSLPEEDIVQRLPLPLTTRDNSKATVLPLAEWERFRIWCEPRLRERPYIEDSWDCGQYTRAFLGLATLWGGSPACGWIDLESPIKKIGHRMAWLLAQRDNGIVGLWYYDATPRPIVPWPDEFFADLQGWRATAMGF